MFLDLEKQRLEAVKKINKSSIYIAALSVILFLILYFAYDNSAIFSIILVVILGFITFFIFEYFFSKKYFTDFKNIVLKSILKEINPNLTYEPQNHIDINNFTYPKIYKQPDRFSGNDFIYGNIDGVEVSFSDMFLEEKVVTKDKKGNVKVQYFTIFKGIFFVANFNKSFNSKTYVLENKILYNLGDRAYMDNNEFEKVFNTYTDDQINARYIITPLLMEQILKTREKFKVPINIAFLDNKIYIYIEFNKDSFEPDIYKSLVGENSIAVKYKNDILELLNLVKELNLNRNIFITTKEE